MDILIVSIIIAAAALYIGNIFFQKFKAARTGETGCGYSACLGKKGCGTCRTLPNNILNQ